MAKAAEKQITIEDLRRFDLDKARVELLALEEKLASHVAEAQKEIDGRKAFIKAIEILIHGKPPRKTRTVKPKDAPSPRQESPASPAASPAGAPAIVRKQGRPSNADRIAEVLKRRGKLNVREIAKATALTEDAAAFALGNDDRFDRDTVGLWELA